MRKAFRIFLYMALGYLLLTAVVLPPILTSRIKTIHLQQTGRELQLEGSWINPLSLEVGLEQLALQDPDGELLLAFDELKVDFSLLGTVFGAGIRFDSVELDGLQFHLRKQTLKEGMEGYSFADILAYRQTLPAPEPEPEQESEQESGSEPLVVSVASLQVSAKLIEYSDLTRSEPVNSQLLGLQLRVNDFTTATEPDTAGTDYQVSLRSSYGGTVKLAGQLSLVQQQVTGDLAIKQLNLLPIWQYLSPQLAFRLQSGALAADIDYQLQWGEQFAFSMDGSRIDLADMDIQPVQSTPSSPNQLSSQIQWDNLRIDGVAVNSSDRSVAVGGIEWRELALKSGHRNTNSGVQVELLELFATKQSDNVEQTADAATESQSPWQITLDKFVMSGSSISWRAPELGDTPLQLSPLNMVVNNISWPEKSPLSIELDSRINSDGGLTVAGQLAPQSLQGQLQVTLDTPLALINPLLQQSITGKIDSGKLGSTLMLLFADHNLAQITGSAAVDRLSLIDAQQAPLFGWQQLAIEGIDVSLAQQRAAINKVFLLKPAAGVHVDADGVSNMQRLAKASESEPTEDKVLENEAQTTPGEPYSWQVAVKEVVIEDGQLDFADESLSAPFATQIAGFGGTVTSFDSSGDKPAKVNLKGLVDEYAPISLVGTLGPTSPTMALDLKFNFDGMELASLSPYSGTYVGRAIDKGQLNLALDYQLQNNRLKGKNKIRIEQISLGGKIDSPDAVSLPLGPAIALLKNASGVIKLNVPVSGKVDDPSFTVAGVVWSAFSNLIIKTVTSPFNLLGSLVGSSDDLQRIPFAPGTAELNDLAEKKLQELAGALAQRPSLKLRLLGQYDNQRDLQYLQQQQLTARLRLDPQSLTERDQKWSAEVTRLYRRQFTDRPVAERPASELYDELAAAEQVDSAALMALADSRSEVVRQQLVAVLNVAEDRVALKPASEKSNDGSQVLLDI